MTLSRNERAKLREFLQSEDAANLTRAELDRLETLVGPGSAVNWRLPVAMIDALGGADGMREMLTLWAEQHGKVEVPAAPDSRNVCWSIPGPVMRILEAEADRAQRLTGRQWSAAQIARLVFDQFPSLRPGRRKPAA